MSQRSNRLIAGVLALVALAVSVHLSGRTVDFRVYHIGAGDFFRGIRPVYGALSGIGWPMHYRYPPLFLFLFLPLAMLPLRIAAGVWVAAKFVVLALLVRSILQRLALERRYAWIPVLLAGPFVIQEFQYGNVQFFIFALVAAALLSSRTRPLVAGAALALGTAIKIWPLFFFPYFAVRRDWKTVGSAVVLTIALTLLPALYFGFGGTIDLLGQWARQEFRTQAGETQFWYPSQSLRGVLMRYLTVIDYTRVPDSEYPRYLESIGYTYVPDANYALVHVAELDPSLVRQVWMVIAALAYAGLLLLAHVRRNADGWAVAGAAWCGLALLQPFTQKYALAVLLWPAVVAGVVVGGRVATPAWVRIAVYASTVLVAIQPFFSGSAAQRDLQVVGLDFFATCLLAAVMAWTGIRGVPLSKDRSSDTVSSETRAPQP